MENLHTDHRKRVRERFLKEGGLESFAPHNIMELLLFYSIPQRDVNEIAHELINAFGSVSRVIDADFDELIKVNGVKENTATLMKLVQALVRYYVIEKSNCACALDTREKIGEYLVAWYMGITVEIVVLLCLSNSGELIHLAEIHRGSVNSAGVSMRKIAEIALAKNAAAVVLAHNHPNGVTLPSSDDINTTRSVENALNMIGVTLVDHYIVAENNYNTILRQDKYE